MSMHIKCCQTADRNMQVSKYLALHIVVSNYYERKQYWLIIQTSRTQAFCLE